MTAIELKDVTCSFGKKQVLGGISLTIQEGEIFGMLGPSGAGKTTLINILTGQLPYGGRAQIFGTECSAIGRSVYETIGAVLDQCGLYERLSCWDNLKLFAKIHGVPYARIGEVLDKVGLHGAERMKTGKLSKGMKQRLQLACAVLHRPRLLFLDEPTSGLDPVTAAEIHTFMKELQGSGTTIFLTTHNMDEAYKMCDRIALLNEGVIAEYGNPPEICRQHGTQSELRIVTADGQSLSLPNIPDSADQLAALLRGGRLRTIHSTEPDLGTVFLKLTGKELSQ